MATHVIYIPGLGDGYDPFRKFGLGFWRRPGLKVTLVSMHWMSKEETYVQKLMRIEHAIDTYPDHKVVLVGESAGGAMVIVAMQRFRQNVSRVVTVCGMNQGAENVSKHLYRNNHTFRETMQEADTITPNLSAQDKSVIKIIYSSNDYTVRPKNTLLPDVQAIDIKIVGHLMAIATVLLFKYKLVLK